MTDPITEDLVRTFDEVVDRLVARSAGLGVEEYLWEPVEGCMTVRPVAGAFRADPLGPDDPDPAPFTTIAWRMWHIGADCLRGYLRFFEGEAPDPDPLAWPGTPDAGVQALTADWARLRTRFTGLGDAGLMRPMGDLGGHFGAETYLKLGLHALDETAHHGAEIGVIRDLYRQNFGETPASTKT
ncbi:DinB family protein [Glycomyces sp. NPDC046736]|uniref:DinB family protein n=1 Tax=Glycomyces sp. NPDC046736 TaxID=3155615 RepID=UPI0033DDC801